METSFRLDNELAVISGGATGIGLGIARCLVAAGARVMLLGRREEPLQAAVRELGTTADYRVHDVSDFNRAGPLLQAVEQQHGPLGILVNNAGIHLKKPAAETTEDEMRKVMEVHVLGAHALSRHAAALMLPRKRGSLLFIASMASLFGLPQVVAYAAAKSALLGLVRTCAVEWSPHGIRVNALAPGWIETEMTSKAMAGDPERLRRILQRTPLGRLGTIQEIGAAAVFLCSPAASFITGACLPVDGGVSIGF